MAVDNQEKRGDGNVGAGFAPILESGKNQVMPDLPEHAAPDKPLSDAARRALEEAAARRHAEAKADTAKVMGELGGPKGPEPTRFGDWERRGIAVDF